MYTWTVNELGVAAIEGLSIAEESGITLAPTGAFSIPQSPASKKKKETSAWQLLAI